MDCASNFWPIWSPPWPIKFKSASHLSRAGNLAKMENEAGIDTKISLHRWEISVCADICCKIKIILIALKNGEVKLRSQWWEKEGRQVPPTDKQPHPLFLLPFSSSPPTLSSAFLPLSISLIHTLTKRMLSSADKNIYIMDLGSLGSLLTKKWEKGYRIACWEKRLLLKKVNNRLIRDCGVFLSSFSGTWSCLSRPMRWNWEVFNNKILFSLSTVPND